MMSIYFYLGIGYAVIMMTNVLMIWYGTEKFRNSHNPWVILYFLLSPFTISYTIAEIVNDKYENAEYLEALSFEMEGKVFKWHSLEDFKHFALFSTAEDPTFIQTLQEDGDNGAYYKKIADAIDSGMVEFKEKKDTIILYCK